MERVKIIDGSNRLLFLVQNGGDDEKIASTAKSLAQGLKSFAVVNQGWTFGEGADAISEMADYENIIHTHEDVVQEEFLHHILRSVAQIQNSLTETPLMIVLKSHCEAENSNPSDGVLDMLLSCGSDAHPFSRCPIRTKNKIIQSLENEGFSVLEDIEAGMHSSRSKNSLGQLLKEWAEDPIVQSVQLSIDQDLISDDEMISMTVEGLVSAFEALLADNGQGAGLSDEAEV